MSFWTDEDEKSAFKTDNSAKDLTKERENVGDSNDSEERPITNRNRRLSLSMPSKLDDMDDLRIGNNKVYLQ